MSAPVVTPPLTNNRITVYQFQPFTYVFDATSMISLAGTSPELFPYCSINPSVDTRLEFTAPSGIPVSYSNLLSLVLTVDGQRFSYDVSVLPGRWTATPSSPYVLYQGEALTPIVFDADVDIADVFSQPSLPPGLRFESVSARSKRLTGTPLLTSNATSYLIVGRTTTGRLISTTIVITVAPERLVVNGGPIVVSGMSVDTALLPRTLTANVPVTATTSLRYTATSLPPGLYFADATGNPVSLPFQPTDASRTIRIEGTPTIATAREFRSRAGPSRQYTWTTLVTGTVGTLTSSVSCSFTFGPTVLFDGESEALAPQLFQGVPLASPPPLFRAYRYFQDTGVAITDLSDNGTLPSGLGLGPLNAGGRFLTGTPTTVGTTTTNFSALDASGNRGTMTIPFTIASNTITLTASGLNGGTTFVQSRDLSNALVGYYDAPISFTGVSAAGLAVSYSASGLEGMDIVLEGNTLTGTPILPAPSRLVRITASDDFASSSLTFSASVLADQFTFTPASLTLTGIQNIAISPRQVFATALSGRTILGYTLVGAPAGLSITTSGQLQGTPLTAGTGTFSIVASTGFATGSLSVSYDITPDFVLATMPNRVITPLFPGDALPPQQMTAKSFVGRPINRYDLSFDTYEGTRTSFYGLTMNSNTGIFSGTFCNSISNGVPIYPASERCWVHAFAGNAMGEVAVDMSVENRTILLQNIGIRNGTSNFLGIFSGSSFESLVASSNEFSSGETLRLLRSFPRSDVSGSQTLAITTTQNLLFQSLPLFEEMVPPALSNVLGATILSTYMKYSPTTTTTFSNVPLVVQGSNLYVYTNGWETFRAVNSVFSLPATFTPRRRSPTNFTHSYKDNAVAVAGHYVDGNNFSIVLGGVYNAILGGSMIRLQGNSTWFAVATGFQQETGAISTNGPVWVAVGSDGTQTSLNTNLESDTITIKYSTDFGQTWSNANGGPNIIGQCVVYGGVSNRPLWVMTGVSKNFTNGNVTREVWASSDGSTWILLPDISLSSGTTLYDVNGSIPFLLGPVFAQNNTFNIFARHVDRIESGTTYYKTVCYSNVVPLLEATNAWVISSDDYKTAFGTASHPDDLDVVGRDPIGTLINTGEPANRITMTFDTFDVGGPTLSLPQDLTYTQYVPVSLVISGTGTGRLYLFMETTDVPDGFTFNAITNTFSGTPLHQGTFSIPILAKDDTGTRSYTFSFRVVPPSFTKRYDGAGAFTSLIRQYTPVNAAQNARDGRVLNTEEQGLGAFMAPVPPDVTSAPPPCDC